MTAALVADAVQLDVPVPAEWSASRGSSNRRLAPNPSMKGETMPRRSRRRRPPLAAVQMVTGVREMNNRDDAGAD
jgi:hypothetical protein